MLDTYSWLSLLLPCIWSTFRHSDRNYCRMGQLENNKPLIFRLLFVLHCTVILDERRLCSNTVVESTSILMLLILLTALIVQPTSHYNSAATTLTVLFTVAIPTCAIYGLVLFKRFCIMTYAYLVSCGNKL